MASRDEVPRRKRLRLAGFDYTSHGAYYITIVTRDRRSLLGTVVDDGMVCSAAGLAVFAEWQALPASFPAIELDEFVVMPNHVHGIIWLPDHDAARAQPGVETVGAGLPRPPARRCPRSSAHSSRDRHEP